MPDVEIIEVGPRDGLQNEAHPLSFHQRKVFIEDLASTGLKRIEIGACVSTKKVPQMAQSADLARALITPTDVDLSLLVANERGLQDALQTPVHEVAVFTACSDAFVQANIGCDVAASLARFTPLVQQAKKNNKRVRGYLSTIVCCPYEGAIPVKKVHQISQHLLSIGCDEVSLGETLGVATPDTMKALLTSLLLDIPAQQLALHCHDTYGQALANVWAALELGLHKFDTSVAGLGGCPFAPGASGNLATEDLVYSLQHSGILKQINLARLAQIGAACCQQLKRSNTSRVGQALCQQQQR